MKFKKMICMLLAVVCLVSCFIVSASAAEPERVFLSDETVQTIAIPYASSSVSYVEYETHNNLFFDAATDERLAKAKAKLEQKKRNYETIYNILRHEVEEHRKQPGKFKLFIGFKRLGIFDSISQAKKYADRSGLWGAFNLLGDKGYRDSWYVYESEIKQAVNQ